MHKFRGWFHCPRAKLCTGVLVDARSSTSLNECVNFESVRVRVIPYTMNEQSGSVLGSPRPCKCRLALREGSWSQRLLQLLHHHLVGRLFGKVDKSLINLIKVGI